jgi:hypothetical protein
MDVLRACGDFYSLAVEIVTDCKVLFLQHNLYLLHQRLAVHLRRKMQRQLIDHQIAMHVVSNLHVDALRIILNDFNIVFRDGHTVVLQFFDDYASQPLIGRVIHHQERDLRLQPVLKLIVRIIRRNHFEADKYEEQQNCGPNQRANLCAAALPVSHARRRRLAQDFVFANVRAENHPEIRLALQNTTVERPEIRHGA